MIEALLRKEIENSHYDRLSVERIQPLLPVDDKELDFLMDRLLAEQARNEFRFVVLGALAANRPVDAKYLVKGAAILIRQALLSMTAMRMRGDVARYLMEALAMDAFDDLQIASILLLIAIWCREFGNVDFPPELLSKTRELARLGEPPATFVGLLVMIAMYTNDEALLTIVRKEHFARKPERKWQVVRKRAFAAIRYVVDLNRRPLLENLPEGQGHFLVIGSTMRRAVARFGRNESCHCGSGKKYKRCCLEKDNARLRRSTDIPGVTRDEIGMVAERVFTPARMDIATLEELECIDPSRLSPELLDRYVSRLSYLREFDRVLETFEKIGYSDRLESVWYQAVQNAAIVGRKELAVRLIRIRMPDGMTPESLPLLASILMLEDDPHKCVVFIEDKIRTLLESNDVETLSELAFAVLLSKFPATGVALARGAAPLLSPANAACLMPHLLRARDRLNLAPEDPVTEVLDTLAVRATEDAEVSEAYREALAGVEAQRRLTRQLNTQMETLQKELRRLEQLQTQVQPASAPAAPAQTATVDKSRLERKIEYLEEQLESSRREENRRRRDLHELPAPEPPRIADAAEEAREEELLLETEAPGTQPIRLLDFPRDFHERLSGAPRHIARSSMAMLGRLAGGDPAAFVGAVRLKICPAVTRLRIGRDWRLLFRILPDRIDAIDLIPRQDFERRIRTLPGQYP